MADWSDLPEAQKCPERDHRRWPCHFDSGHAGEHAFTDADEMRILRDRLTVAEEEVAQLRNPGVLAELTIHEGESEQFYSSPIGLSYSALGLLEMHYEPSWEDIAAKLAASFTKESFAEAVYDQILRRQGELLTATVNAPVDIETLRAYAKHPQEVREAREIFTKAVESTFSLVRFLAALQDLQEEAGIHPDIQSTASYWRGRTRTSERILDKVQKTIEQWSPCGEDVPVDALRKALAGTT